MTLERFAHLLDAYGARIERWPDAERPAARALLERSAEARAQRASAERLDALLDRVEMAVPSAALATRVLATAPHAADVRTLPVQSRRRTTIAAAAGLALAASLALWFVRAPTSTPSPGAGAMAQLGVIDVPTDALLSDVGGGLADDTPAFGCDDPALGCDEAEPANRSGGLGSAAKEMPA